MGELLKFPVKQAKPAKKRPAPFSTRIFQLRTGEIRHRAIALIQSLRICPDYPIELVLREPSSRRTNRANAYYWLRLGEIAEQAWVDGRQFKAEVWHEHAKNEFAPKIDGPRGLLPMSTTEMEVGQFCEYVNQIERWASYDLGVDFSANPEQEQVRTAATEWRERQLERKAA